MLPVAWHTSKRTIDLSVPKVMGILNVTPDSFSDGGRFDSLDAALRRVEEMVDQGVDIVDVGGESTRPQSAQVSEVEEIGRVVPVIEAIATRFDVPISIDTYKSGVAESAVFAGAEIINDISGLRFDPHIADVAARQRTALVLMHSRGEFETMHSQPPMDDIFRDIVADFARSTRAAQASGISQRSVVLDIGIGFGKTLAQNLELIAKLGKIAAAFPEYPLLVGVSRKSFIGKVLGRESPEDRLAGSLASAVVAVWNGAAVIRAHDVRQTVDAVLMAKSLKDNAGDYE